MKYEKKKVRAFWIRIGLILLILMGFLGNTLLISARLDDIVRRYIANNNAQLAAHLAFQIQTSEAYLEDFATAVQKLPKKWVNQELLDRKAETVGIDAVYVVSREPLDEEMPHLSAELDGQNLTQWARQAPVWDASAVSVLGGNTILITAPVPGEDGLLVIGVKSYQKIQASFRDAGTKQDGLYILLDTLSGSILMVQRVGDVPQALYTRLPGYLQQMRQTDYQEDFRFGNLYICADQVEGTHWIQISLSQVNTAMSSITSYIWVYFGLVVAAFILVMVIVYQMKVHAKQKERRFLTDTLTGGCNREGFISRAEEYIRQYPEASYAVVWMNLSEFRTINALWGEDVGNKTLKFIYQTLASRIHPRELVCRSQMDRFILLINEKEDAKVSQRILAMIAYMNQHSNQQFGSYEMNFVIGACRIRADVDVKQAIANATSAGKTYKNRNECVFYDDAVEANISDEVQFNDMFDSALQNGDFKVYLQPKVGIQPDGGIQAEALVRWLSPEKGVIGPDKFIPLFERNGKICQLDLYVFEEVCRLINRWQTEGKKISKISVNISRFHLRNVGREVWQRYDELKRKYAIADGVIEIELIETVMIDVSQLNFVKEVLRHFRACGFSVALDDFGFAFSSLGLLKEFEIDTMKLDRSFFVNENDKSRQIVENLIHLAHGLNMSVVAEGVEQAEQVQALQCMTCDYVQGYVYSRPLPIEEFEKWRENYDLEQC